MSEIDIITDVRQSPDSAELIVVKQKIAISGESHPVGPPVETGVVPFAIDKVAFVDEFEHPHDVHGGEKGTYKASGGSMDLVCHSQHQSRQLQPREEREYFLPSMAMFDRVAQIVESLSPKRYRITAFSGGEELCRVDGEDIRPFIGLSLLHFHPRVRPLFDTLGEADRLAVLMAVDPLRRVESEKWPSLGATPIEGEPDTFVVRAGEELGVVVIPTKDQSAGPVSTSWT
jgi:hypothetical protein